MVKKQKRPKSRQVSAIKINVLIGTFLVLSAAALYAVWDPVSSVTPRPEEPSRGLNLSGPVLIKAERGKVLDHLKITSNTGDCLTIQDSSDITLENSEIGPCVGSGIRISGGSNIKIYDSYIHPDAPLSSCCDKSDGIFADGTSNLTIQGNVVAYGESNIEVFNATVVRVIGNFLLNPRNTLTGSRGQNFQSWKGSRDVLVENNFALASPDTALYKFPANQEDSMNFGETDGVIVRNNYITGGHSRSGCGLMADIGANNVHFIDNILVNTGQCGIGISDGVNQVVQGNRVMNRTPIQGGGNTAIYVWKQYAPPCGPVTVAGNIATQLKPDGTESSFWDGGGCGPVKLSKNVWGAHAASLLSPIRERLAPPRIPPQPHTTPANSPFTDRPVSVSFEHPNTLRGKIRGGREPSPQMPQSLYPS